jgi:putative proteasome-type protease
MTYAVALNLDAGLIFASDSRTNAGMDSVATFRKMHVFDQKGERLLVLLTAGNLAITQSVVNRLKLTGDDGQARIDSAKSLYDAAEMVGQAVRDVFKRDGKAMRDQNTGFTASFILGGQIAGEAPRLFNIYAAGNFIESSAETPYFQIGETKYGKPIIDRLIKRSTPLDVAAKCVLISFDSTMRSNVSVAPPIDLLCYRAGELEVATHRRLAADDAYLLALSRSWGDGIRRAFDGLPAPDWMEPEVPKTRGRK